ncbi:MAG TPA: hypothetical protein VK252_01135 [Solirubrobacteraceae bacterium]|nr:hypothetical protein [Solirubrobacteraceae bacterium]
MAGINATILAIAIAAFSGYVFMVWQSQQAMETEAVERANATRRAPSRLWWVLAPQSFNAHGLGLGELRDALERIVFGVPNGQLWDGRALMSKLPSADNTQARGEALLVVLSAMWRVPPIQHNVTGGQTAPEITGVGEVETWLNEIEWPMRRIVGTLRSEPERIEKLVGAIEKGSALSARQDRGDDRVEVFTEWAENYLAGVQETKAICDKLRRYEGRRLPSRPKGIAVAALLATVFLCGVIVPLVHPSATEVVYAYIPAGFYVLAMGYALFAFGKDYRR